ncbi:ATP-dependent DNA/RNA helicase DHX36 [Pseudolycoriella hygida]|uniref:RNA helicase n=1 Tax=Pseudolycoriella hygida TaxID=35572 RepID=A0A9Q0RTV6_9DIPT|nr:ATP-dependent DNA/RNA helicase DHX36 [Pseudolycoriella hygida]
MQLHVCFESVQISASILLSSLCPKNILGKLQTSKIFERLKLTIKMSKSVNYIKSASRLRNELRSRTVHERDITNERAPPGLRGRELGMWYAQRSKQRKEKELEKKLLSGPSIYLPSEKVEQLKKEIVTLQANTSSDLSSRVDSSHFSRYRSANFMELIKTEKEAIKLHRSSELDKRLYDDFQMTTKTKGYTQMLEFRQKLPSFQHIDEIIDLVTQNNVVLIAGKTGCGKTTQVAQYILDHALTNMEGSKTKIICTQPRRIAATSIAERVATERGEELGHSVGYQIRLEKIPPRSIGSILFCTTGVLLKFLEISPTLNEYSHIIIDEIHERNAITDVCLALIKKIIEHRKDLKVILMSATLNEEKFVEYFNDCPVIHIEGITYPVEELFLEDIVEETGFDNFSKDTRKEPIWCQYKYKKQRINQANSFEMIVGNYVNSLRGKYSQKTINTLKNPATETIDLKFIQHLIQYICCNKPSGAILVILPGFTMISQLHDSLLKDFPPSKFIIYPLHSLLTGNDHRNIFRKPPDGVRKIIVSTPLSETSITIEDVVYVINAGKMRRPFFDFDKGATIFEDEWITKANEIQRKGRAGRVQKGICYHLYTRGRSNVLEPFEKPEILRIRLEETILSLKVLCIQDVRHFMTTLIDVPEMSQIDASVNCLRRIGALTDKEELTPLGLHLAQLGVHPKVGKMLLLASIFSCFDPIASISAALSFKSPFYTVMGKEDLCNRAKRKFSPDSDQLAVANAITQWRTDSINQRSFCHSNFLSHSTMVMLDRMKSQFVQSLYYSKFLNDSQTGGIENNRNSENVDLLKAIVGGGTYPNIAYRSIKIRKGRRIDKIITTESKRTKLLPSSVNGDPNAQYEPGFMVFQELNKFTHNYYITETTSNVSPFGILLFGDEIVCEVRDGVHYISVGGMIEFRCNSDTIDIVVALRDNFNRLIENKILKAAPVSWDSDEGKLLTVIMDLLTVRNLYEDYKYQDVSDDDDDDEIKQSN